MAVALMLSLRDVRFRWPGRAGFALSVPALDLQSGEAVLLLSLDEALTPEVIAEAEKVEGVKLVKALSF